MLALEAFHAHDCCPDPAARIEVEVRTSVTHTVTVNKVKEWLDGGARSPKERILKNRLKERLVGLRS